MGVISGRYSI